MWKEILLIVLSVLLVVIIVAGTATKILMRRRLKEIDGANGIIKKKDAEGKMIAKLGDDVSDDRKGKGQRIIGE